MFDTTKLTCSQQCELMNKLFKATQDILNLPDCPKSHVETQNKKVSKIFFEQISEIFKQYFAEDHNYSKVSEDDEQYCTDLQPDERIIFRITNNFVNIFNHCSLFNKKFSLVFKKFMMLSYVLGIIPEWETDENQYNYDDYFEFICFEEECLCKCHIYHGDCCQCKLRDDCGCTLEEAECYFKKKASNESQ